MALNETLASFAPWIQILLPQPCYDKFLVEFDIFDVVCLKIFISKCLGYAIIVGSILVKLPQIIKILSAKSGEGLSLTSILLELLAITAAAAYGFAQKFPISAYGDSFSLCIQTSIIGFCVLHFGGRTLLATLFASVYVAVLAFCMSPIVPMWLLVFLQASNMPVVAVSKLIQVFANYSNGTTGQLSIITYMLLFGGSLARIFTSIQETGDNLVIMTYVVSSVCNGIVVSQIFYYWNVDKTKRD